MKFRTREEYETYKVVQQHRAFMEAIGPFLRHKYYVVSICLRPVTLHQDGRIEHGHYPEWAQKQFDQCDEFIAAVARSFAKARA